MKEPNALVGFIFLLAAFLVTARGKTCQASDQCLPKECCVTKSSILGGCREKISEGYPCTPEKEKSSVGDMYLMSCPCEDGFECVPEKIVEDSEDRTIEYLNPTCQLRQGAQKRYGHLRKGRKVQLGLFHNMFKLK